MYDRIISADSHVAETEAWYEDIGPKDRLTRTMSDAHARMITHDNVAKLYGITV